MSAAAKNVAPAGRATPVSHDTRAKTLGPPQPYVVMSRRGRLAQIARQSLRVARVHHGRATNRTQHLLSMLESGREVTYAHLDGLAHDLRVLDLALARAAVDIDDIVAWANHTALVVQPLRDPPDDGDTLSLFPNGGAK